MSSSLFVLKSVVTSFGHTRACSLSLIIILYDDYNFICKIYEDRWLSRYSSMHRARNFKDRRTKRCMFNLFPVSPLQCCGPLCCKSFYCNYLVHVQLINLTITFCHFNECSKQNVVHVSPSFKKTRRQNSPISFSSLLIFMNM